MANFRLTFIGDTYVSREDPDSAFAGVTDYFQNSDIVFCNLETVLADAKYLGPDDHNEYPRTDEWMFESHVRGGINVVSQANNPNTYHGHAALVRSLEVLDAYGVTHGGVGRNLAEAGRPAIIERNGTKVAFVCRTSVGLKEMEATDQTPGLAYYPVETTYEPSPHEHDNPYNYPGSRPIVHTKAAQGKYRAALEQDIANARELADFVVVAWHWGLGPWHFYPGETIRARKKACTTGPRSVDLLEYQPELGHTAIDFGADIVIGTGSHFPGPIEFYRGKPIFYSIGNFVHDKGGFSDQSHLLESVLVQCDIEDSQIQRLSYIPGTVRGNGPAVFTTPTDAIDTVELVHDLSASFETKFEVGEKDVTILNPNASPVITSK